MILPQKRINASSLEMFADKEGDPTYAAQTSGGPLQALRKETLPLPTNPDSHNQHGKTEAKEATQKEEDLEAGGVDQGEKGDGEPRLEARRRVAALGGCKGDEEKAGGDETKGGDEQGAGLGKDGLHGDHGGTPEEERGHQHHQIPPRGRAPLDIDRRNNDHALHIRPCSNTVN